MSVKDSGELSNCATISRLIAGASREELRRIIAEATARLNESNSVDRLTDQLSAARISVTVDVAMVADLTARIKNISLSHPVHFLSFGVGATGSNLNSSKAMDAFKEHSKKNNLYLGSTVHDGGTAGTVGSVLDAIQFNFSLALKTNKHFVLYYHGHGTNILNSEGNWCLAGATLAFSELVALLTETRADVEPDSKVIVTIISDCCYSGKWTELWRVLETDKKALLRIVASCKSDMTCYDGIFPKFFFRVPAAFSDAELNGMGKPKALEEIFNRKGFKDDHGNVVHGTKRCINFYDERGYQVSTSSYNQSDLGKENLPRLRLILKMILIEEKVLAMQWYFYVKPSYCGFDITAHHHTLEPPWCSDGGIENYVLRENHCASLVYR